VHFLFSYRGNIIILNIMYLHSFNFICGNNKESNRILGEEGTLACVYVRMYVYMYVVCMCVYIYACMYFFLLLS
jgi:hypothetical protein